MKVAAWEDVVAASNARNVRYLSAGGLAVNAHGYVRLTMDIDLVIAFDTESIHQTLNAPESIGYQPRSLIDVESLATPQNGQSWQKNKGIMVHNFVSDRDPATRLPQAYGNLITGKGR